MSSHEPSRCEQEGRRGTNVESDELCVVPVVIFCCALFIRICIMMARLQVTCKLRLGLATYYLGLGWNSARVPRIFDFVRLDQRAVQASDSALHFGVAHFVIFWARYLSPYFPGCGSGFGSLHRCQGRRGALLPCLGPIGKAVTSVQFEYLS